jgi:xanthine dehydrogenase small subunit
MRDHVLLTINGERHGLRARDGCSTLTDLLRNRLGLRGTKVVCSEGDCGACSVLVGRPHAGRLHYRVVDACITFVFQLDLCHVITVEGLGRDGHLHPVQEKLIEGSGSQ